MSESISVIIASRGRPWALKRAVDALTQGGPVEVLVGLDADDPTRGDAEKLIGRNRGVEIVALPRHDTIHALDNTLAEKASGKWLMLQGDDYWIEEPEWVERLQPTLAALPMGLGVTFPNDIHYPGFPTCPIVSRETAGLCGFFMPPWFPFLFADTWWFEVGALSGMMMPSDINITLGITHGNEHRYRDLRMWGQVFAKTRPMRSQIAIKMVHRVYGEDSEEAAYLISTMPERIAGLEAYMAHQSEDEWINRLEVDGDKLALPSYVMVKERAEAFLSKLENPTP